MTMRGYGDLEIGRLSEFIAKLGQNIWMMLFS